MKTNAQLLALNAAADAALLAALSRGEKNVDHNDLLPLLQTLLSNERAFLENQFSITPTFLDNTDGTGTLTLQIKDGNGTNITSAVEIEIGFSATAGGIYADLGTVAATTGTVTRVHLSDGFLRIRSNASGVIVLTLTTADEWFVRACVVGSSQATALESSYTVTGP